MDNKINIVNMDDINKIKTIEFDCDKECDDDVYVVKMAIIDYYKKNEKLELTYNNIKIYKTSKKYPVKNEARDSDIIDNDHKYYFKIMEPQIKQIFIQMTTGFDCGTVEIDNCEYEHEDIYKGEMKNGKRYGNGKLITLYNVQEGVFEDDNLKIGQIYDKVTNELFEGNFTNDMLNGFGKKNSEYCEEEGYFINNVLNGKGKRFFSETTMELGNFEGGQLNGEGRIILEDKIMEGEFVNGELNGIGIVTLFKENSDEIIVKIQGEFENSVLNGYGKLITKSGCIEEGKYMNYNLHGYGKRTTANFTQEGQFSNDDLNGYGKRKVYFFDNIYLLNDKNEFEILFIECGLFENDILIKGRRIYKDSVTLLTGTDKLYDTKTTNCNMDYVYETCF